MKNQVSLFLSYLSYGPTTIKDTEFGKLRILENDVKDQALTKAVFKKGKDMASRGDIFLWFEKNVLHRY